MRQYTPSPSFSELFAVIANPKSHSILDFENVDQKEPKNIILGPDISVLESSSNIHASVRKRFANFKAADWTWWEFEFFRCQREWHTFPKGMYDKMIKTIAWQWEGDAAAAKGMLEVVGCFINESACLEYETRIADNEILHALTYANMVESSFADPAQVRSEILNSEKIRSRLMPVSRALSAIAKRGHEYRLGLAQDDMDTYSYGLLYEVIMYILEKLQFNPSFLMTHLLTSDGSFAPIATAVQKIAVDELNYHVPHRKYVIQNERSTPRGQEAWRMIKPLAQKVFNLVLDSELSWLKEEIFADGKELPGGNLDIACLYTCHCAYDVATTLGLDSDHELVEKNPVFSMAKWLNIDGRQGSPQDEKPANYAVITVTDDEPSDDDLLSLCD